ncbi:MAG: flagellar export protein FliJ [Thiogranum sp.]|nr:flagellar export protein FliJ [Thiogranum sp.]
MQPVQRVAQSREQAAMRKLGQSQQYLDEQCRKLDELRAYREQYTREFESCGGGGLGAMRLQDYRVFLGRLNEAVRQQEAIIAKCQSQHEKNRQLWLETRGRAQAIENVVQGYCREERRQMDRKEQREQDEHAQRPRRK